MPLTKPEFLEALIEAVEEGREVKLETKVFEAKKAYLQFRCNFGLVYQVPLSHTLPEFWEGRIEAELLMAIKEKEVEMRQREAKLYIRDFFNCLESLGYEMNGSNKIKKIKEAEPESFIARLKNLMGLGSYDKPPKKPGF